MVSFNGNEGALRRQIAELEAKVAALQNEEERTAIALANSRVGIFDWQLDVRRIYVSPILQDMLGYGAEGMPDNFESWLSLVAALTVMTAIWAMPPAARGGNIFVVNQNLGGNGNGTFGEYTTSGATVNASLITGLNYPLGIAVSGGRVFVANSGTTFNVGTIGEYTLTGATVNASLITGLNGPVGIAVLGGNLFITENALGGANRGRISEYTTSGATVNASLITSLNDPLGIAASGGNLFVVENALGTSNGGTIGEYTLAGATVNTSLIAGLEFPVGIAVSGENLFVTEADSDAPISEYTTSGATVNASLVTGLNYPLGIAVSGNDLFVANYGNNTIGEYTTSGATVNASLITGLNGPYGIAVTPEPSTLALGILGALSAAAFGRRLRGKGLAALSA
jgi:DNA-binding beta-propeller fold protein YncE